MNIGAQLQIRRLYAHSSPSERQTLSKYLKPLPEAIKQSGRSSEPLHIREILPAVMADIQRRTERAERRERRGHER